MVWIREGRDISVCVEVNDGQVSDSTDLHIASIIKSEEIG
jgi:hypothetical protein